MTLREQLHTAIGRTDASEGLPHWHTVSDTPDGQPRHSVYVERQAVLDIIDRLVPPAATPAGVLDEAWAAAEKALPEGAGLGVTKTVNVASGPYVATTDYGPVDHGYAYGPTPADALHALAAALGRSGSGGGRG